MEVLRTCSYNTLHCIVIDPMSCLKSWYVLLGDHKSTCQFFATLEAATSVCAYAYSFT